MRFILLFAFAMLFQFGGFGQFFTETFETGGATWNTIGTTSENDWITSTCAGNGGTLPGTNSLYITKGGTLPGCGVDGIEQHAYENAPIGSSSLIRYSQVNGLCYTSMSLSYDFQINGDANDYAEIVISTDGISWNALSSVLFDSPSWTNSNLTIPALYDNSVYYIGVRFTYDNTIIDNAPIAVDNFEISGTDNNAPTAICPGNQTLYTTSSTCDALLPDYSNLVTITDICNDTTVTIAQNIVAGTAMSAGSSPYTIIMSATDGDGNSGQCQFDVSVIDTIAPSITCPTGPFTQYLDASCQLTIADYSNLVVANDNCESVFALTITQSPPAGSIVGASATINYEVQDSFGNAANCSFLMNAVDTISPLINCPPNDTVSTTVGCGAVLGDYTSLGMPSDNCTFSGSITITQSPTPGTNISSGDQIVSLIADDGNGNTGTCTFIVTVEDQVGPTITSCVPNQTVFATSNCDGVLADYTNLLTVSDNCSATANLTFSQSPSAGTTITGTTLITITVTDENSNSTNCQFSAFLSDTIPPTIICPNDTSLSINSSCQYVVPNFTGDVTGTDNCSSFGAMTVQQFPAPGATASGITNVTFNLIDDQGNTASCVAIITPIDSVAPTIACPTPTPIDNGISCDYTLGNYVSSAVILDNCPNYSVSQTPSAGSVIPVGTNTITLTVLDAGGNTNSCSFDLEIFETQNPTIVCPNDTVSCDPIVSYALPTFSDNCLVSLVQTDLTGYSSGSVFPVGTTTLEYTTIDSSENTGTCQFSIEILPFADPATIQEDTIFLCGSNSTLLQADSISSGSGQWTVSAGTGSFNNEFAYATGVNSILNGTNLFVWTVSSPSCGSTSDSIYVISTPIDLTASTQDTIIACETLTVPLQANQPIYGTGVWSTNTNAVITDNSSANTSAGNLENGWNSFIWTITNPGCPSTSDTLEIFAMCVPQIDQADTAVCLENDLISVSVSNAAAGQEVSWSSPFSSVSFGDPNAATTTVEGFDNGINYVVCSFDYGGCNTTQDTIKVAGSVCNGFDPVIPTVFTPGNFDGKNDLFNIDFLDILYPDCHVVIFNRWGSVVFESDGYSSPWNGTHKGELLPMGTYYYKIELNDTDQQVFTGDISIIN